MRFPICRCLLALPLLLLATPATAALTKPQQACVNTENTSWQKLAATVGKETAGCIKSHNNGLSSDIPACVVADDRGKVATAADVLVVFEGTGSDYHTAYTHPAWVNALTSAHFAHLVHGEATSANMEIDLDLARARKAGMVYVTDDVLVPNPWDKLATYWSAEIGLIALP
jgi:hypothetical protein